MTDTPAPSPLRVTQITVILVFLVFAAFFAAGFGWHVAVAFARVLGL
jgi:hypothetical protein